MNDSQPSTIPKDTTGSSILEQENNSEVTEDEQQTTKMETADSSASLEAKMEKESEKQLLLFVSLLTVRVLTKCHALQNWSQEGRGSPKQNP